MQTFIRATLVSVFFALPAVAVATASLTEVQHTTVRAETAVEAVQQDSPDNWAWD